MTRAVGLVVAGIASVQLGAAVAKELFDRVDPTALVWLRLVASAVLLLLLARPRLRGRDRGDWQVVAGFALTLAVMNWAFYQSFARLPLGVAVTIELIGPLAVALAGSRRAGTWCGSLLAAVGVTALGWERTSLDPVGVAYAVLAGDRVGVLHPAQRPDRPTVAGARRPLGGERRRGAAAGAVRARRRPDGLLDPRVLALGALIGVLSSVIPYSLELVALRSLRPSQFGILMSIEPAAAALAALPGAARERSRRSSGWRSPAWWSPAPGRPGSPRCHTSRDTDAVPAP